MYKCIEEMCLLYKCEEKGAGLRYAEMDKSRRKRAVARISYNR